MKNNQYYNIHDNINMIHVRGIQLFEYLDNPKKLVLNILFGSVECQNKYTDGDFFDKLSENKIIRELHLIEDNKGYETNYVGVYEYIKFPPNLRKLVLPDSYDILLKYLNAIHSIDKQPQLPVHLEEIIISSSRCLKYIKLNDNIKKIIIRHTQYQNNDLFQSDRFSSLLSLQTIQIYECSLQYNDSMQIQYLTQTMDNMKLPYGCICEIFPGKYSL